jgi:predicted aspartyl protease
LRVRITVAGHNGEKWALVDTGFDGDFSVPDQLGLSFGAPHHTEAVQLASGRVVHVAIHHAVIELIEQPEPFRAEIIVLGDEYLIGTNVLNRYKVTFDHGQRVTVET